MKEALDRLLARLRMRLAKSPLPGFFGWWGSQLLACLPERWSKLLGGNQEALLVELGEAEIIVSREQNGVASEFGRIARSLSADDQAAEFHRLRSRIENPGLRQIFCLPDSQVLSRQLNLPAAAEDNLRQVLGFEMDRQTPFKADQVYFDSRIVGRDTTSRNLKVEVVVVPRTQLDPQLVAVAGGMIAFDAADVRNGPEADARRRGINLLPAERRARRRDMRLPLNLGLAAAVLVLLYFNMSLSLSNRQVAVETMQGEVAKAAEVARQVLELKKQLGDSVNGANYLSERKRNGPMVVGLLNDLAGRLDDDTYLERLSVEDNQIQIQGQSKEAASLISALADSPYLANPKLEGQIQPDPRTGKDRFTISAEPRPVPVDQPVPSFAARHAKLEQAKEEPAKEKADGSP